MFGGEYDPSWPGPVGTVQVAVSADAVLVTLSGAIDSALTDDLEDVDRTLREHALPVMIDATAVTFMDSTGAQLISRCHTRGPLTVAASPPVRFLLTVLGLEDVVTPPRSPH
jgi:anti-anti-sigma regulatory factor